MNEKFNYNCRMFKTTHRRACSGLNLIYSITNGRFITAFNSLPALKWVLRRAGT